MLAHGDAGGRDGASESGQGHSGSRRPAEQSPAVEHETQQVTRWLGVAGIRHCSPPSAPMPRLVIGTSPPAEETFARRVISLKAPVL